MSLANLKVRQIVDSLCEQLDCTQKVLCSLIGVTPTSLSLSVERQIVDIADNKVGKRLMSLLYVVESLGKDKSLTPIVIKKVLTAPYFPAEDGTYLDVVSAIQLDNIPNALLIPIADAALKQFRSSYEIEKRPPQTSLYSRVIAERRPQSRPKENPLHKSMNG